MDQTEEAYLLYKWFAMCVMNQTGEAYTSNKYSTQSCTIKKRDKSIDNITRQNLACVNLLNDWC